MIARILDTGMAKKRISNVDLSWLISEALDAGKHQTRTALAVVPDEKDGWRVIISIRGRRYWATADEQRLADIQRRLRLVYELRP
jgi:hypothetical protein